MEKALIADLVNKVRREQPLVHNITNIVAANFTANGLLALGASPVMAAAREETEEMARKAGSVVFNIGTLNESIVESMLIAGKAANKEGVPLVLDPVGAGATSYRTESAQRLLRDLDIAIVRGNAGEIANLAGERGEMRGVDAGEIEGNLVDLAVAAARKWNTVIAMTGKTDIITDGQTVYAVHNGHPILTKVTGTGCLLTSVIGAFAAVEKDFLKAAAGAAIMYGVAAEIAAGENEGFGPASFQLEFLNQLYKIKAEEIERLGSYEKL